MKSLQHFDESAEAYLVGAIAHGGFAAVADLGVCHFEFGSPERAKIWATSEALHTAGEPATFISVSAKLGLSPVEVLAFGSEDAVTPIPCILKDCASRLRTCYMRRRSYEIAKQLTDDGDIDAARMALDRLKAGATGNDNVESLFANVQAILDGGIEQERPTVAGYLYAGRLNEFHAEPSTGKTNVSLALSSRVVASGGVVLYLDPEDTAQAALRRLLAFGAKPADLVSRFHHVASPAGGDYAVLGSWAKKRRPQLVVVDGLAEAMAGLGLDEDKPADFLAFCRERLKPFTDCGAAVLISDHVVKSAESRGRWARGTGAKMGRYDGVSYSAEVGKPYSPTVAGFVKLKIAKDRNGGVGTIGQHIADVHFTPTGTGTTVEFRKPEAAERFIPTGLMEKVSRHLESNPEATKRELRTLGKSQYVEQAIDELEDLGNLKVENEANRMRFSVLKPYREGTHEG